MANADMMHFDNGLKASDEQALSKGFSEAFRLVDDIVLKNYITKLSELEVIPLDDAQIKNNLSKIRLFKITEMVYEKDESATYKFASVFNAVAATNSAIITIIDSDGVKTDFYLGIRALSGKNSTQTAYSVLVNAMQGLFPGIKTQNLKSSQIQELLSSFGSDSISSVSCIANNKNKEFIGNDKYLQGLEKLALAMRGQEYTAVIIANSTPQNQLNLVRQSYENIYTQLSPYANTIVSYGANVSDTSTQTNTQSTSQSYSHSTNITKSRSYNETRNTEGSITVSEQTAAGKIGATIGSSLAMVGSLIGSVVPGVGTAIGAVAGGTIGSLVGSAISTATNKSVSTTTGGKSESSGISDSESTGETETQSSSSSIAYSAGTTSGESRNMQLSIQNKPLIGMLDRIDKQLERLSEFESIGMWECAAYFLSNDASAARAAAATYKALMSGENSGLEVSAINTWNQPVNCLPESITPNREIAKYIRNFIHPVFAYHAERSTLPIPVMPTSLVSSNELAIHMGLPRNSVCGFPVIEHAVFGMEIVKYNANEDSDQICFGKVFNMGQVVDKSDVSLDINTLSSHTFITGSTGSGKSNTIYTLLDHLIATRQNSIHFMVIEPAKGEYKRALGYRKGVTVLGTNPTFTRILKINPFQFPKGIHVLEHVDRLIEIFNVCWPMYAAMPAVLKDAILAAYEACGWDLACSTNIIENSLFPTFQDLHEQLILVINNSAYSEEVKSNYIGSLVTRIRSLANGLNGQIFVPNEIDNQFLFDSNVIIDLSRIGSQETKALLMGILIMRLSEYRMSNSTGSNQNLRHLTILEEAHNILGVVNHDINPDGSNIAGKAVEMISNSIAEMRTYGEGFVIADQSPGAVDISAIRNTNTKIIMRLPDESDRRISGKAAGLKDFQLDEIARLPQGVAVIYQNDWLEPVLCKIDKFIRSEKDFSEPSLSEHDISNRLLITVIIKFVLHNRLNNPDSIELYVLKQAVDRCNCSVRVKTILYASIQEYNAKGCLSIWNPERYSEQAHLVADIIDMPNAVKTISNLSADSGRFTCYLNSVVAQKLDAVTDDLILEIDHCLLKVYSGVNRAGLDLYKSWIAARRDGRSIL